MNPEVLLLVRSRRVLLAVARVVGVGALVMLFTGCVVAPGRGRAVVKAPAPAVVVRETPRHAQRVVVITEPPPPPRREVIVERDRPSVAHVWIKGHWRHDGRAYAWVPGHWERPPRANVVWVEPQWVRRGGNYIYIEGVWR